MKIFVTGGAGFVGSHLVDRLVSLKHEVVIIDHHKAKKERFINPGASVYKIAVGDEGLEEVFKKEKPDVIFHLAAQISVTASVDDPVNDAQINVLDSVHLLDLAAKYDVKRFIFASSGGAIYGDHPVRPTPEDLNAFPLSPYGVAKQTVEHYLQHFSEQRGLSSVTLRFSNIYGPRQQMVGGYAGVMPIFISRLLSGEPVTIFGDGSSTRDYVFVDDAVDAFVAAMNSEVTGIMNISTGKETSVLELWNAFKVIHGTDHVMEHAADRPGEVQRSQLLAKLAEEVLNWKPETSIDEGLQKTYDWFKER